jgi:PilZ domain
MPNDTLTSPRKPKSQNDAGSDRRSRTRYKFGASAELITNSNEGLEGRVSDLSDRGCYIDAEVGFPVGTTVKIRIRKDADLFEAAARVVYAQDGKGMGVLFRAIEPQHVRVLEAWVVSCQEHSWLAANRRRSQRILLRVPVRASGTRDAVPPIDEATVTTTISAHGTLILLSTPVRRGQPLVLTNEKTSSALECVVAHVGEVQGHQLQIGVSFLLPNSAFWHVSFPPADWTSRDEYAKQFYRRPAKP